MRKMIIFCLFIIFPICLVSCTTKNQFLTLQFPGYLNTDSTVRLEINNKIGKQQEIENAANLEIKSILQNIEKEFAGGVAYTPSLTKTINENAGSKEVSINETFIELYKKSLILNEITDDAFSPVMGSLVELWDISHQMQQGTAIIPSDESISEKKELINVKDITFNEEAKTIKLNKKGMALDFGAIAKGYATDKIANYLDSINIPFYVINLGGNIYVKGESQLYKDANRDVTVGIDNPFEKGIALNILPNYPAISVSASNQRFIIKDGIRYSHILSPFTGMPVNNEIALVAVNGKESTYTDALSTGLFVSGLEKATEIINGLEGYEAVIITKDYKVHLIGNINYQNLSNQFELIERK